MNNLSLSLFLKKHNSIRIFYCDIFKTQGKITLHVITNCYKRFFSEKSVSSCSDYRQYENINIKNVFQGCVKWNIFGMRYLTM